MRVRTQDGEPLGTSAGKQLVAAWVTEETKRALLELAARDDRRLSAYLRRVLEAHVRASAG